MALSRTFDNPGYDVASKAGMYGPGRQRKSSTQRNAQSSFEAPGPDPLGLLGTAVDTIINILGTKTPPNAPDMAGTFNGPGTLSIEQVKAISNNNSYLNNIIADAAKNGQMVLFNPQTGGSIVAAPGSKIPPGYQMVTGGGLAATASGLSSADLLKLGQSAIQTQYRGQQDIAAQQQEALAGLRGSISDIKGSVGQSQAEMDAALKEGNRDYADLKKQLRDAETQGRQDILTQYDASKQTMQEGLEFVKSVPGTVEAVAAQQINDAISSARSYAEQQVSQFTQQFTSMYEDVKSQGLDEINRLKDRTAELLQTETWANANAVTSAEQQMQNDPNFQAMSGDQQSAAIFQNRMAGAMRGGASLAKVGADQLAFLADQESKVLDRVTNFQTAGMQAIENLQVNLASQALAVEGTVRKAALDNISQAWNTASTLVSDMTKAQSVNDMQVARDLNNLSMNIKGLQATAATNHAMFQTNTVFQKWSITQGLQTLAMQGEQAAYNMASAMVIPNMDAMTLQLYSGMISGNMGVMQTDFQNDVAATNAQNGTFQMMTAPLSNYLTYATTPQQVQQQPDSSGALIGAGIGAFSDITSAWIGA